jgi:hypothetical protein
VFRSRTQEAPALRYYIYVSDAKLEMLFERIGSGARKRISAEVNVDLRLASLTLRGADNPGPARLAKLQLVERFIEKQHHVGTIERPGREYFRGKLDMDWGWIGLDDRGVWFQGNDFGSAQYVGLGGSRYHVRGEIRELNTRPRSRRPYLVEALEGSGFLRNPGLRHGEQTGDLPRYWPECMDRARVTSYDPWSGGVPPQPLEFLAVPLAETVIEVPKEGPVHVVIGTPLYVATPRLMAAADPLSFHRALSPRQPASRDWTGAPARSMMPM